MLNNYSENSNSVTEFSYNIIVGKNSVWESVNSNVTIDYILIDSLLKSHTSFNKIIFKAKQANIHIKFVDRKKLDEVTKNSNNQGIAAFVTSFKYSSIDYILNSSANTKFKPLIIILDQIQDPHNLGAIIRTAEAAGVNGIIIPKHNSASVTDTVFKTSAGAVSNINISKVTNLSNTIKYLKSKGLWITSCDMIGQSYCSIDFTFPTAIIIGGESNGVSKSLLNNSDYIASLPMIGKVNSLNASVASGIIMYEVLRQRTLALA